MTQISLAKIWFNMEKRDKKDINHFGAKWCKWIMLHHNIMVLDWKGISPNFWCNMRKNGEMARGLEIPLHCNLIWYLNFSIILNPSSNLIFCFPSFYQNLHHLFKLTTLVYVALNNINSIILTCDFGLKS